MKEMIPKFGFGLVVLGTAGFLVAVITSFTPYSGIDQGALPAASFLSLMIGIAFAFPSLLKGPGAHAGFSTMRIIVFAVVLLFCTIYMKIGWSIGKMEDFTIDKQWIYILGLAFGSKAFQRYTENEEEGEEDEDEGSKRKRKKQITVEEQTETTTHTARAKGKDTSADLM